MATNFGPQTFRGLKGPIFSDGDNLIVCTFVLEGHGLTIRSLKYINII